MLFKSVVIFTFTFCDEYSTIYKIIKTGRYSKNIPIKMFNARGVYYN